MMWMRKLVGLLANNVDDETCGLVSQFGFFFTVSNIYNLVSLISFGFMDYEEEAGPPIIEYYVWLWTTNYDHSNHKTIHFLLYCNM